MDNPQWKLWIRGFHCQSQMHCWQTLRRDTAALENVDVEACTPYLLAGELSGSVGAIVTDRSSALAVTCNPANTTAAKNGNNSNSCDAAETGDAETLGGVSMILLVGSLVVAVFGFDGL
jgi:hypothetical protein